MRRVIVPALMIIALLLGGCGESDKLREELDEARAEWNSEETVSFTANVTAELSGSSFQCTLLCTHSAEETVVEILSPEIIAGIKARLKDGETEIEYDGIILAVGDPMKGEISPLSAMPMIMEALLSGHVTGLWTESEGDTEMVAAEVYISENEYAKLWFDTENYTLIHAELVSGAKAVVKCEIVSFTKE